MRLRFDDHLQAGAADAHVIGLLELLDLELVGDDLVGVDLAALDHLSGGQVVLQLIGGAAVDVDLAVVDGVDLHGGLAGAGESGEQVHGAAPLAQLQGGIDQGG